MSCSLSHQHPSGAPTRSMKFVVTCEMWDRQELCLHCIQRIMDSFADALDGVASYLREEHAEAFETFRKSEHFEKHPEFCCSVCSNDTTVNGGFVLGPLTVCPTCFIRFMSVPLLLR